MQNFLNREIKKTKSKSGFDYFCGVLRQTLAEDGRQGLFEICRISADI
jgi:hypothetical protein